MGVDGEEVGARGVAAGDDEVGADVALVAEQVLLEECHAGDDAGLAAGGERVQLELGGDEGGGELGVGGGAGAGTPDLGGDVVKLFAVLVGDDGARGGSRIGGNLVAGGLEVMLSSCRGLCIHRERGRGDLMKRHRETQIPNSPQRRRQRCSRQWLFLCWLPWAEALPWRAGPHCGCSWRSRSPASSAAAMPYRTGRAVLVYISRVSKKPL